MYNYPFYNPPVPPIPDWCWLFSLPAFRPPSTPKTNIEWDILGEIPVKLWPCPGSESVTLHCLKVCAGCRLTLFMGVSLKVWNNNFSRFHGALIIVSETKAVLSQNSQQLRSLKLKLKTISLQRFAMSIFYRVSFLCELWHNVWCVIPWRWGWVTRAWCPHVNVFSRYQNAPVSRSSTLSLPIPELPLCMLLSLSHRHSPTLFICVAKGQHRLASPPLPPRPIDLTLQTLYHDFT